MNPKDIEAYKIYAQIMTKEGKLDKAAFIMEQSIDNCGANGDSYYILAQIQKLRKANDEYVKCLNYALKFNNSLTVSPKIVKNELDKFLS